MKDLYLFRAGLNFWNSLSLVKKILEGIACLKEQKPSINFLKHLNLLISHEVSRNNVQKCRSTSVVITGRTSEILFVRQ